MTCTNFPKYNLTENVTQHQVGNVTYLYKGGAPTAPLWEAITGPLAAKGVTVEGGGSVQGFIDTNTFKTVAEMKVFTNHIVGSKVVWQGYYSQSDGGSNWGVVKSGAHVDDGGSIFSIGTDLYIESNLKGKTLQAAKFGTRSEVGFNNREMIQSATNYAVANGVGTLRFSKGRFEIAGPWVVDMPNFGRGLNLTGEGVNETEIHQTAAGIDCLKYSATTLVEDSTIDRLTLSCASTAGDVLNIGFGLVRCNISPRLKTDNPARSLIVGNFTDGIKLGVFDTTFEKAVWLLAPNSTAHGVDITCNGTIFNENKFRNLVCYNATAKKFFSIKTQSAGAIWLINNAFSDINFEVCRSGGIEYQSARGWSFKRLSFWDASGSGAYTSDLIHAKAGTSLASVVCTFDTVIRNGDTLASGVNDILIDAGNGNFNTYIDCFTPADVNPRYDFNNAACQIIGLMHNVVNGTNTSRVGGDTITANNLSTNNLSIGTNGKISSPATSLIKTEVLGISGTHQLKLKNYLDSDVTYASDQDGFYSYTSGAQNLGQPSNLWKEVFSAAGTVNTSDARAKDDVVYDLDDRERSAALQIKKGICRFKFKDAIESKGHEGARVHFGVLAQDVAKAFTDNGLDPHDYSMFCYDEWEADEVSGRGAGNAFGVRYTELLCFVIAAI